MDKTAKEQWIDALRSGEYEQGYFRLRGEDNTYCVLGVLCDVLGDRWQLQHRVARYDYEYKGHVSGTSIPRSLGDKIGLSPFTTNALAEYNDTRKWPFDVLANWIEQNVSDR